jgi:putative oxidoreductase
MTHSAVTTHAAQGSEAGLRVRLADLLALVGRVPLSIHQLLFRLAIAGVFLRAGLTKIMSWESTVALFADEYKVPVLAPHVAAALSATFELGCSSLLLLGLGTRLAALPLLGMITTIQLFVYPQAWPEHLVWGAILLFLLTRGGGTISLDHLIARTLGRD